jgi:hypothetical protein
MPPAFFTRRRSLLLVSKPMGFAEPESIAVGLKAKFLERRLEAGKLGIAAGGREVPIPDGG